MDIHSILSQHRKTVDRALQAFFVRQATSITDPFLRKIYQSVQAYVLRPGKRIRPIMTIMAYNAVQRNADKKIVPVSIIPELFHASSLIHDDIMDEDHLRRKKPTMHVLFEQYYERHFRKRPYAESLFSGNAQRFGASMAIIQGNILYSLAYDCLLSSPLPEKQKHDSLQIVNDAFRITNEGQIRDVLLSEKESVSENQYVEMARAKTAANVAASIQFGALLGGASKRQLNELGAYAADVGVAFQIHDDVLDVTSAKGRLRGSDIRKGNKTILFMHAVKHANTAQKRKLLGSFGNEKATARDVERCVSIMHDVGSITYATHVAHKKSLHAKQYLQRARITKSGELFFRELADYMVRRLQ